MKTGREAPAWFGLALFLGLGVPWACAVPGSPTGGPRDEVPPMIESTWPDTFEFIEATRDPVVIRFNERISERPTPGTTLDGAVLVSPVTGEHRVKHTRSGLEIDVAGGFQPGLVYRVRVLPVLKDMFNNSMVGPFELVFSTGGEFEENVLAGLVTDRLTGDAVAGVRVEARNADVEDGPTYMATTDTAGIYALRYVPAGVYGISIYEDVNRNGEMDFRELQGETDGAVGLQPPAADTIVREVALLRPDTTPAELIRAEAQDSALLLLSFDDFLVPEASLDQVQVQLTREEEEGPGVEQVLWEHQWEALRAINDSLRAEEERLAMVDSLSQVAVSLQVVFDSVLTAGDSVAADSLAGMLEGIRERIAPPEPEEDPEPRREEEPEPVLPQQFFYVLLSGPLAPEELYQLTVGGVDNINGIGGGGGEAGVTWTPPEPPPDTAAVPPDTAAVPPDTTAVPPDTAAVPPDTAAVPPDTVGAPPDTSVVLPWRTRRGANAPFLREDP